jgi:hypothetical protein
MFEEGATGAIAAQAIDLRTGAAGERGRGLRLDLQDRVTRCGGRLLARLG